MNMLSKPLAFSGCRFILHCYGRTDYQPGSGGSTKANATVSLVQVNAVRIEADSIERQILRKLENGRAKQQRNG
jgi:hypothetical protein